MEQEIQAPSGNIKAHKLENPQKVFFFERWDGSI